MPGGTDSLPKVAAGSWAAAPELGECLCTWRAAVDASPRLARVRELIESCFPDPVSVADASRVAALERNSFSRHFRHSVGVTFTQWQRALRVAYALRLLENPHLTVEAVAHRAGFGTVRSLQRAFQAMLGTSPSGVKKAARR